MGAYICTDHTLSRERGRVSFSIIVVCWISYFFAWKTSRGAFRRRSAHRMKDWGVWFFHTFFFVVCFCLVVWRAGQYLPEFLFAHKELFLTKILDTLLYVFNNMDWMYFQKDGWLFGGISLISFLFFSECGGCWYGLVSFSVLSF